MFLNKNASQCLRKEKAYGKELVILAQHAEFPVHFDRIKTKGIWAALITSQKVISTDVCIKTSKVLSEWWRCQLSVMAWPCRSSFTSPRKTDTAVACWVMELCDPLISKKTTFTTVLFKGKPWHIYSARINGGTEGIRGPVNSDRYPSIPPRGTDHNNAEQWIFHERSYIHYVRDKMPRPVSLDRYLQVWTQEQRGLINSASCPGSVSKLLPLTGLQWTCFLIHFHYNLYTHTYWLGIQNNATTLCIANKCIPFRYPDVPRIVQCLRLQSFLIS